MSYLSASPGGEAPEKIAVSNLLDGDTTMKKREKAMGVVMSLVEQNHALILSVEEHFRNIVINGIHEKGGTFEATEVRHLSPDELIDEILFAVYEVMGRDHVLSSHLPSVGALSRVLAEMFGEHRSFSMQAYAAGAMHDIGKVDKDIDTIVSLKRRFDDLERRASHLHSDIGNYVLQIFGMDSAITRVAANHHEKLNGKGYPNGLLDHQIDFLTRIVSVADAIDAMLADRPGRIPSSLGYVISELKDDVVAGKYDARVVAKFMELCEGLDMDKNIKTLELLNQCGKLSS